MLENKHLYLLPALFFGKLTPKYINTKMNVTTTSLLSTCEYSRKTKLQKTGFFFKRIAFISLAFNMLVDKRFKIFTLKSLLLILWNTLNAYNVLF